MTRFASIDPAAEMAIGTAKSIVKRMVHGRMVLVVEKVDGRVMDWWADTDKLTTREVDRLMREKPGDGRR